MIRDLLVHVDGGEAGRQRVRLAVEMAERAGARLTGLHVMPPADIRPLYKPSQVEAAVAQVAASLARMAAEAAKSFEEETLGRLPAARWLAAEGDVAQGVIARARYADVVILGQYEWQGPGETHAMPISASIALKCGRPVLVVPDGALYSGFASVAVAWDGSREAVRAVHDAMPLLRDARSVHLLTVIPLSGPCDLDPRSLVDHLVTHGVKVEARPESVKLDDENRLLQRRISQGEYDLLIMGAYSHPMWVEFVFGGATNTTLLSSRIPVLVSH
jgi:nucleotide-binding universal stress UspA family protein